MLQVVPHLLHLVLQGIDFLVQGFGVELGNLAHRFFYQFEDIFHHNFPVEEVLVVLHLG